MAGIELAAVIDAGSIPLPDRTFAFRPGEAARRSWR
jgi:hypothetical protein